jgi:hypothetical protein
MNQKYLRYGLITLVLAVWGIIGYKVIAALTKGETTVNKAPKQYAATTTPGLKDTFSLLANYSDPFLPVSMDDDLIDSVALKTDVIKPASTPVQEQPIDISFIQYLGMISNVEKKTKAAVISIRGKETIVREKDVVEDVLVKSISTGKIAIVYKKKNFNITRQF